MILIILRQEQQILSSSSLFKTKVSWGRVLVLHCTYKSPAGILLKCGFWSARVGWVWKSAFQTSSQVVVLLWFWTTLTTEGLTGQAGIWCRCCHRNVSLTKESQYFRKSNYCYPALVIASHSRKNVNSQSNTVSCHTINTMLAKVNLSSKLI